MNINTINWIKKIKANFNSAASKYSNYSFIQKHFCKKLIFSLKKLDIPPGNWFDLGCGAGFLADQIEREFPEQNVIRVDFSQNMLLNNKEESKTILWDLNLGLPPCAEGASLLVSNFCLHWLEEPEKKLKNYYDQLAKGGFLIVSFPTKNCFPEWIKTCTKNNIEYSGLDFPDEFIFKDTLNESVIFSSNNYTYKENFPNIYYLFRNIIDTGAQSSKSKRKTVKEFRKLQKYWPKDENGQVSLTWEINILIVKKP